MIGRGDGQSAACRCLIGSFQELGNDMRHPHARAIDIVWTNNGERNICVVAKRFAVDLRQHIRCTGLREVRDRQWRRLGRRKWHPEILERSRIDLARRWKYETTQVSLAAGDLYDV